MFNAQSMYLARYAHKLLPESTIYDVTFCMGFPEDTSDICDILAVCMNFQTFAQYAHLKFDGLSLANQAYKVKTLKWKKSRAASKRRLRVHGKLMELRNNFIINKQEGVDYIRIPRATFEKARDEVAKKWNQRNQGYALELCLEQIWNEKAQQRGIDFSDAGIEVKFFNGQVEL